MVLSHQLCTIAWHNNSSKFKYLVPCSAECGDESGIQKVQNAARNFSSDSGANCNEGNILGYLFSAVLRVQQSRSDRHDPVPAAAALPRGMSLADIRVDGGVLARGPQPEAAVPGAARAPAPVGRGQCLQRGELGGQRQPPRGREQLQWEPQVQHGAQQQDWINSAVWDPGGLGGLFGHECFGCGVHVSVALGRRSGPAPAEAAARLG